MRTFPHPLLATLPSVLVIGKESEARSRFHRILRRARFRTLVCAQLRDAIDLMPMASVVVCHQPLPGIHWQDVLRQAEKLQNAPSVVVTIPRPLTIDLDDANQRGVFTLLEPYSESEVTGIIRRAHAEYQAVRQLQSSHTDGRALFEQLRTPVAATTAQAEGKAKWLETSSTVRFGAPKSKVCEATEDMREPVSVN